ncbi:hypothetical protein D3C78_1578900 [compost metagenome]
MTKNVINSFVVQDKVLNTVELTVAAGSRLEGRAIDGLRAELEITFLMMQPPGGEADWNPAPELKLDAGARVLVVTTLEALSELELLNQPARRLIDWMTGGTRDLA